MAQLAGGMGSLFLDLAGICQVLGFTAGVSALACLLFGLAPAFKATALAPVIALKAGSRGIDGRRASGSACALLWWWRRSRCRWCC